MQAEKEHNRDPLFALVKSLNATEKAYFKKYVQGDGDSNYLKLFDAINAMQEYDEKKLLQKFKNEKFIRNLAVSKTYLFDLILDSLRAYNRNKSVTLKAENMLGNLRILYEKGLTEIFERQLEKAKEFAESNELTYHYLEMLELERPHNYSKTKSNLGIQRIQEEELIRMLNRIRIAKVNERVLNWIYKNEKVKSEDERMALDELMNDSVFREPPEHFNFTGKNSLYSVWSFYYYALGDFENSIEWKEKQFRNYIEHPSLKKGNEKYFLLVLGNLLSLCYSAANKEKFDKYFELMKREREQSKENEMLLSELFYAFEVVHYKLHAQYEQGCVFVNENENALLDVIDKFSLIRQLDVCYNSAFLFFKVRDFKSALKWINRVLQNKNLDDREFLHCYTRIFQLIIHYELENTDLMNSLLRSTYRYLSKRKRMYDFEEVMLGSMKKIIRSGGAGKNREIFEELRKELNTIKADPYKKHTMDHFDYDAWLEEKINELSKRRTSN